MLQITSTANQIVKKIASLATKKGRQTHQLFCAEGTRTIATIVAAGRMKLVHLLVTENMLHEAVSIADETYMIVVSQQIMKKISSSATASGILAVFQLPITSLCNEQIQSSGVVLAQLQDPGNVGTLIRTAAALGLKQIVCIEGGADPYSPKVVQASAGTIGMLDIIECSWHQLVKSATVPLCALVVRGGETPEKIGSQTVMLVVGSEGHGLPAEWIADCKLSMTIPMPGGTESLNAAVAGSIALYLLS